MTNTDYVASIDFTTDPETIACSCDGCDWAGMASDAAPIESCSLTPGDPSPAGRCPECDSLIYVVEG